MIFVWFTIALVFSMISYGINLWLAYGHIRNLICLVRSATINTKRATSNTLKDL